MPQVPMTNAAYQAQPGAGMQGGGGMGTNPYQSALMTLIASNQGNPQLQQTLLLGMLDQMNPANQPQQNPYMSMMGGGQQQQSLPPALQEIMNSDEVYVSDEELAQMESDKTMQFVQNQQAMGAGQERGGFGNRAFRNLYRQMPEAKLIGAGGSFLSGGPGAFGQYAEDVNMPGYSPVANYIQSQGERLNPYLDAFRGYGDVLTKEFEQRTY